MNALIGYTGLVGQNLDCDLFGQKYNSKNIREICGKQFELVVCAGVPGHKTMANRFPEEDWRTITLLMECLCQVRCERFVLISTIDVYEAGVKADEDTPIKEESMPYAAHRIKMEQFAASVFDNSCILRLPGIFGKGLSKNFIFDLIFRIPRMMDAEELAVYRDKLDWKQKEVISKSYLEGNSNIKYLNPELSQNDLNELRNILEQLERTSLRFTDSRSYYSYYDLSNLIRDMKQVLREDIHLINLVTEPMSAKELSEEAFDCQFDNEILEKKPAEFQIRSKYAELFHGSNGYLYRKEDVIRQLRNFDRSSIRI